MKVTLSLCLSIAVLLGSSASLSAATPKKTITLDVRNTDIYAVLQMLAQESGRNIVPDNTSVKHDNLTLSLHGLSFDEALHTVEMADGLQDVRENGVIFVGSADAINRHFSGGTRGGLETRVFALHSADATQVSQGLSQALTPGTVILPDPRTHSVVITGDQATLQRANTLIKALDESVIGTGVITSQAISLHYIKASDAVTALHQAIAPTAGESIIASPDQNAVVVTGSPDDVAVAQSVIQNLDQPGKQVVYQVRVVDIQPINDSKTLGLTFGGLDLNSQPANMSFSTSFATGTLAVNATLNALISSGHGTTLATPRIAVLNNHDGSLLVGETRPISFVNAQTGALQVQFIDIGVKLELTPTIGSDGYITTDLHPEFSSLLGVSDQGIPIISNRKVDTTLRVKDGESIVLAGLLQDIVNTTVQKVPWLGDMPVFGALFRNTTSTHTRDEVVFIITPHIVTESDQVPGSIEPLKATDTVKDGTNE